ncbi:MAG: hypothetical protein EOO89_20970 [Pedobacter sp.]|nr:MAG: hypothetical protein EOO89_20970 [Pedobacter sp.]
MKPFKLDNEPKISSGFKVPENYFEDFTASLMQNLPAQEVRVVPLYRRTPVWLSAVAAIFIIALSLSLWFRMDTTNTQPDEAAIEDYLVYQANISSYDLIQNLDISDIKELEQNVAISDEAIEDYLQYETIYTNE